MQKQNLVQLEIEHILFELSCCINNLQDFRTYLSVENVQQADISLQKLNVLISNAQYRINYSDFLLNKLTR
ncbi:MAG: hypothetical protein H0U75_07620 [Legionella sp.]|nr:hypothetical protein [Legionella sp.]